MFSAQRPTVAKNSEYLLKVHCHGMVRKYEIWELNSKGPAFSVPKPWGPQKWLFRSKTVDACSTYIWLNDTTIGCVIAET